MTFEDFLASACLSGDLSVRSSDMLNLDDQVGVQGVIWDDMYWATFDPETGTWHFEAWDAGLAGLKSTGDYMAVAKMAYEYARALNG